MSSKGINPKKWFYDMRAVFREGHARTVFAGAACEQWINGELFNVVAQHLRGSRFTAYPEYDRYDLAVLDCGGTGAVNRGSLPSLIVETKVVYRAYSPKTQRAYLRRLRHQLARNPGQRHERVGLLFGIFSTWMDLGKARKWPTLQSFQKDLSDLFLSEFKEKEALNKRFKVTLDHGGRLETFLDQEEVTIGGVKATVGCVAQYVRLQPR